LTRNMGNWFFTRTAQQLADKELQERVKEHASK
jgi:adenosyl cobinamide kinase/adenosyl cobinamide phosphate guanylyltransferase